MKLLRGSQPFQEFEHGTIATIGNFDGVHIGHQALLRTLRAKADALKLPLLVILFEPQPAEFFHQDNSPARLTSLRDKMIQLKRHGADFVYCMSFNRPLSLMEPAEFVQHYLCDLFNLRHLHIGRDFRFGRNREGDVNLLQSIFTAQGRTVSIFSDFKLGEERVSSTKIRRVLSEGDLIHAKELLGRDYSICRRVIKGDGRGRQWGIPTANFNLSKKTLPLSGVFCVKVVRKNCTILNGVANMGCRPTVDGKKNNLEVHLFDFDQSLYGELLDVQFLHKLRDEAKFSSLDALIAKIKEDITIARRYFEHEITV